MSVVRRRKFHPTEGPRLHWPLVWSVVVAG